MAQATFIPYSIDTTIDPVTGQSIVAVISYGLQSDQYRATFVSSAPNPSLDQPTVLMEAANIVTIVQAAVLSPTIAPGDLPASMIPTPAGDISAAQDIVDAIAVADAATPSSTNS